MAKKKPLVTRDDARTRVALRTARKALGRFRWGRRGAVWDPRGDLVTNPLRQTPAWLYPQLERLMEQTRHHHDLFDVRRNVDPRELWSFQSSLARRKLVRYVRHFRDVSRRPKNCHYPFAVRVCGKLVLWDGNHRTVGALLRGETLPRVNVLDIRKASAAHRRQVREEAREAARMEKAGGKVVANNSRVMVVNFGRTKSKRKAVPRT